MPGIDVARSQAAAAAARQQFRGENEPLSGFVSLLPTGSNCGVPLGARKADKGQVTNTENVFAKRVANTGPPRSVLNFFTGLFVLFLRISSPPFDCDVALQLSALWRQRPKAAGFTTWERTFVVYLRRASLWDGEGFESGWVGQEGFRGTAVAGT